MIINVFLVVMRKLWFSQAEGFESQSQGGKGRPGLDRTTTLWVAGGVGTIFTILYFLSVMIMSSVVTFAWSWLVVTMGRTTRLGRNGQKMHRRPWKRLLHFFSVWFSWFSETESGCCDNGANLLVIDSNLDSIYAFQLSDGVPNASIRCFIFHSIPDIAWALQSILIKEGLKKKENQNTKDHFVNSVPRIEKSPYLAQTLRNT